MNVWNLPCLRRRGFLKAAGAAVMLGVLPFTRRVVGAETPRLKIGMIGSGRVGSALGRVWAHAGHEVMFSSRNLGDDRMLAADIGARTSAGTPAQAAAFGEVLVFAVPYGALPELGQALAESIRGKVLIDTCHPFPQRDGAIAERALELGVGLVSAELLPGARVVRAFNAIDAARMGRAHREPRRIGMPIAGDDRDAIEVASGLILEIGYEPVPIGGAAMGKYLLLGTPLAGEHTAEEIQRIITTL